MPFNIPAKLRQNEVPPQITGKGLQYKGELIDYRAIEAVYGSDEELEIAFRSQIPEELVELAAQKPEAFNLSHAGRKPLLILIDKASSYQLLDLERFVEAAMMQHGIAAMGDTTASDGHVVKVAKNLPKFDMSRVTPELASSYSFI